MPTSLHRVYALLFILTCALCSDRVTGQDVEVPAATDTEPSLPDTGPAGDAIERPQRDVDQHWFDFRMNLGTGRAGIAFGNYPVYSGIRFNLSDRDVERVNGLNLTFGLAGDMDESEVDGIAIGLIGPKVGRFTGLGIGGFMLDAHRESDGIVGTPGVIFDRQARFRGIQLAGLGIVAGDLGGVSLAGLGCLTNGDVRGISLASLLNLSEGSRFGLHGAGLVVLDEGGEVGASFAGVARLSRGRLSGIQLGGLGVRSDGDLTGIQIASVLVGSRATNRGIQLAGIASYSSTESLGIQLGGLASTSRGPITGLSGALFLVGSHEQDLLGVSASGLLTFARRGMTGVTAAGLAIHAGGDIDGLALAGGQISAVSPPRYVEAKEQYRGDLNGIGIAGLDLRCANALGLTATFGRALADSHYGLAVAGYNSFDAQVGLSIGLLNRADQLDGVQVGLLNYCAENPHPFRWLPLMNANFR